MYTKILNNFQTKFKHVKIHETPNVTLEDIYHAWETDDFAQIHVKSRSLACNEMYKKIGFMHVYLRMFPVNKNGPTSWVAQGMKEVFLPHLLIQTAL